MDGNSKPGITLEGRFHADHPEQSRGLFHPCPFPEIHQRMYVAAHNRGMARLPHPLPPATNAFHRKTGRALIAPHAHPSGIPTQTPKLAHQFLLFRVYGNHRKACAKKRLRLPSDVTELRVSIRMLCPFQSLRVRLETVSQLVQQRRNRRVTHAHAFRRERLGGVLRKAGFVRG